MTVLQPAQPSQPPQLGFKVTFTETLGSLQGADPSARGTGTLPHWETGAARPRYFKDVGVGQQTYCEKTHHFFFLVIHFIP